MCEWLRDDSEKRGCAAVAGLRDGVCLAAKERRSVAAKERRAAMAAGHSARGESGAKRARRGGAGGAGACYSRWCDVFDRLRVHRARVSSCQETVFCFAGPRSGASGPSRTTVSTQEVDVMASMPGMAALQCCLLTHGAQQCMAFASGREVWLNVCGVTWPSAHALSGACRQCGRCGLAVW